MSSYFEKPQRLERHPIHDVRPKPGTLTRCRVDYQDPANPQKMLRQEMNAKTGEFGAPKPLEIQLLSGEAAKVDLNKHVSPVKKWNLDAVEKPHLGAERDRRNAGPPCRPHPALSGRGANPRSRR